MTNKQTTLVVFIELSPLTLAERHSYDKWARVAPRPISGVSLTTRYNFPCQSFSLKLNIRSLAVQAEIEFLKKATLHVTVAVEKQFIDERLSSICRNKNAIPKLGPSHIFNRLAPDFNVV